MNWAEFEVLRHTTSALQAEAVIRSCVGSSLDSLDRFVHGLCAGAPANAVCFRVLRGGDLISTDPIPQYFDRIRVYWITLAVLVPTREERGDPALVFPEGYIEFSMNEDRPDGVYVYWSDMTAHMNPNSYTVEWQGS